VLTPKENRVSHVVIANLLRLGYLAMRSAIIYLAVLSMLRACGKRHVAQLSIVDFVLVLLVSNAVQNAMVGSDNSVEGGLVAAGTLLLINVWLTRLVVKNERLGCFLEGEPSLLVRDGQVLDNHLAREGIRRAELEAAIREHGFEDVAKVKLAILEIDGSISVVPFSDQGPERRLPPLLRHRHAHRRGYRPGQS
jgi:uncharacterized membrane protein YcaP (DUF421 family)